MASVRLRYLSPFHPSPLASFGNFLHSSETPFRRMLHRRLTDAPLKAHLCSSESISPPAQCKVLSLLRLPKILIGSNVEARKVSEGWGGKVTANGGFRAMRDWSREGNVRRGEDYRRHVLVSNAIAQFTARQAEANPADVCDHVRRKSHRRDASPARCARFDEAGHVREQCRSLRRRIRMAGLSGAVGESGS